MRGLKITTFGMLIITLNVRIVNISVFTAILVRLNNTHAFGHLVIFSDNKVTPPTPKSEGACTLLVLMVFFLFVEHDLRRQSNVNYCIMTSIAF